MGPHPAVAEVRRAVRPALRGGRVMVACSGGPDSLALAAAVAFEAPRAGSPAGLVSVDHGLQPGSGEQAMRVAQLGYELGLDPVHVLPVTVGSSGGPESAARTARYAALDALADALDADLLLGHTLDDQAETVLLGLGRGSGPRSIAGMQARHGRYLRPLLGVRRTVTEAACAALGLAPWHDPHNRDPSYRRVRLRHEVLPLLEDVLHGGVAEALARTAEQVRDDLQALDALAADTLAAVADQPGRLDPQPGARPGPATTQGHGLDVDALAELPKAVRTRVLRAWVHGLDGGGLSAAHLAGLDALITGWHGQGPLPLPGRLQVHRSSGRLLACRDDLDVQAPPPDPPE